MTDTAVPRLGCLAHRLPSSRRLCLFYGRLFYWPSRRPPRAPMGSTRGHPVAARRSRSSGRPTSSPRRGRRADVQQQLHIDFQVGDLDAAHDRVVVGVGLALSLVISERYHHRVLTLVFLWATMGLAWNIISGYAGQISFGHQAFFGIGAYVTVLLAAKLQLIPWIGMLGGVGVAVLAADAHRHADVPARRASTSDWPRSPTRSSSGS